MGDTIDYRAPADATPPTGDPPAAPPRKPPETIGYGASVPAPKPAPKPATPAAMKPAATVGFAAPASPPRPPVVSEAELAITLASTPPRRTSMEPDATIAVEDARFSLPGVAAPSGVRATVLPRIEGGEVVIATGKMRYERVKPLGEGGMGEVTLARDHDIDRPVAIKRLRSEQRNTGALLRFAQEVRTIGRLEHPNIVPVHDVGVDEDGQHYFVMKYVEGDTLERIIEKLQAHDPVYERRFTIEARAQLFLGILRAVQYAHAQGIIHRDIKPANVMVGPYGEVMVMDWGLARPVRGADVPAHLDANAPVSTASSSLQTQHGAIMGTPHYMSPEQARGETDKIDERTDVYSLGVMFHELISLRHYLDGKETVQEILYAVAHAGDHERNILEWIADATVTGAPMEFLHFVRHAIAADPAQRYPNAGEMAQTLEDILAGKMKVQCHVTATKRTLHDAMHAVDRHPLIATVLLFALIGMAGAWVVGAVLALLRLSHAVG